MLFHTNVSVFRALHLLTLFDSLKQVAVYLAGVVLLPSESLSRAWA